MRIGELSRRTGVHERLLRYYEEQGLLRPARRPSGYREYTEVDLVRARHIRSLLAAGLNTATIGVLLPCLREEGDRVVPMCAEMLDHLERERARIDQAIGHLLSSRAALDEVITAAPPEVRAEARAGVHTAVVPAS